MQQCKGVMFSEKSSMTNSTFWARSKPLQSKIPLVSPSIEDNFLLPTRATRMTRVTQIGYKSDTNDASDTNLWQMQPSSCRLSTNITREETAHPQTERLFYVKVFVLFCVCSKDFSHCRCHMIMLRLFCHRLVILSQCHSVFVSLNFRLCFSICQY